MESLPSIYTMPGTSVAGMESPAWGLALLCSTSCSCPTAPHTGSPHPKPMQRLFPSPAWQQVEQQLDGSRSGESTCGPVQYVEKTPNPGLKSKWAVVVALRGASGSGCSEWLWAHPASEQGWKDKEDSSAGCARGAGWVSPAGAEVTLGVLGGDSWPQALWWGCCTASLGCSTPLLTPLAFRPSPATKGFSIMLETEEPPVGTRFSWGQQEQLSTETTLVWWHLESAACRFLQQLRAPQGRECSCRPSLAFWGRGTGVEEA